MLSYGILLALLTKKKNESFEHLKPIVVSVSTMRHKDKNVKLLMIVER